jgi:hypothetical protein
MSVLVPERRVIARSFRDFLSRALVNRDGLFYFEPAFEPLRVLDVPYKPPLSWLRREYHSWSLDPEVGPETCRRTGCARLRVNMSVLCRRHHFESIQLLPYPFDD